MKFEIRLDYNNNDKNIVQVVVNDLYVGKIFLARPMPKANPVPEGYECLYYRGRSAPFKINLGYSYWAETPLISFSEQELLDKMAHHAVKSYIRGEF